MSVIYILIPLTLILTGAAVLLFMWAVKSGQFDDCDTPAHRMLVDDTEHRSPSATDQD